MFTIPELFLTSDALAWENLRLRAFHEPDELEGWVEPPLAENNLVMLTQGEMRLAQRDKTWHIRQGDFFLVPSGAVSQPVRWQNVSATPMQTLHVHVSQPLLTATAAEMNASAALMGRVGFQDPLLMQVGLALRQEAEHPCGGKLYIQSAAQFLAVHLLKNYSAAPAHIQENLHGLSPRQLHRITEFIHAHLSDDLALTTLAEMVGFSPYHFARLFRQTTGQSPHQFVLRTRLEHAHQLLKNSALPLAEIALVCGFASQSHLTRMFKQRYGLTPAAYRRTFL